MWDFGDLGVGVVDSDLTRCGLGFASLVMDDAYFLAVWL